MSGATFSSSARARSSHGTPPALPRCRRRCTSSSRSGGASRAAISSTISRASRVTARQAVETEPLAPCQGGARAWYRGPRCVEIDAALCEDEPDIRHDREGEEGAHDDVAQIMRGDDDAAPPGSPGEDTGGPPGGRANQAFGKGGGGGIWGGACPEKPTNSPPFSPS